MSECSIQEISDSSPVMSPRNSALSLGNDAAAAVSSPTGSFAPLSYSAPQ